MKTSLKRQIQIAALILIQVLFIVFSFNVLSLSAFYVIVAFFLSNLAILIWIFIAMKVFRPKNVFTSDQQTFESLINFGEFSMLQYDENHNILQLTGLLKNSFDYITNKKLSFISSELSEFVEKDSGVLMVKLGDTYFEVTKLVDEDVLVFKCVDELVKLKHDRLNNEVVIGLLQIDNYNEAVGYNDEREVSQIIATLRKMINDWAFQNQMVIRRLRDDRYFLVTKTEKLEIIKKNAEAFLKEFKTKSEELNVSVTSSVVFACGGDESSVLDTKVNELLELAQARGGDQMVIQKLNGKIEYYGGNTESFVVKSKTNTRIIADTFIDLIQDSDKVFVFGHQTMDFDSMGSCIAVSALVKHLNKEVYIVSESGGLENKLENYMGENMHVLNHHQFISDTQANILYEPNDLVVFVDHHNPKHSAAQELAQVAIKTVVIDHHRRGSEFVENPILTHLEAGASSVCEMMIDMLQACPFHIHFIKEEALLMYTGIVVDTNHFVARTNSKTFEACAYLKEFGIDVALVREILSESISDFKVKSKILDCAYQLNNMMIAPLHDSFNVSRATLSQIADQLVDIRDIDAAFAIGYIQEGVVAISARSNKNVNVQMIMEKMQGGGHFNAAAVQIENTTVEIVEIMLKKILEERE